MRLGRPGLGRQVLLEDLPGRAVAEAAARGVVEPVGEPAQVGSRERLGRALAWQEAPGAAVQVLDATLLPGGVRVAASSRQWRSRLRTVVNRGNRAGSCRYLLARAYFGIVTVRNWY